MASTPLKKSMFEAAIILQGFLAAIRAVMILIAFLRFAYIPVDISIFLIEIPLSFVLWWTLLFTIITQVRLNSQITARQTLYFEIFKSAIITVLAVGYVVIYLVVASRLDNRPWGPISILHRVYSSVLVLVFNTVLFYSTLWVGWKGTREGGISLGEEAAPLLPQ